MELATTIIILLKLIKFCYRKKYLRDLPTFNESGMQYDVSDRMRDGASYHARVTRANKHSANNSESLKSVEQRAAENDKIDA